MGIIRRPPKPARFKHYSEYRPFLREVFLRRCAYCRISDTVSEAFEIDHFKPIAVDPSLEHEYRNLYYCCAGCNRSKSDEWPSAELIDQGFRFVDPCRSDAYKTHLVVRGTGVLEPKTNAGRYTCLHIRLNRPFLIHRRKASIRHKQRINSLLANLIETLSPAELAQIQAEIDDVRRFIVPD